MDVKQFIDTIKQVTDNRAGDYFTGVPDSLLAPLCDHLLFSYGIDPRHHLIAANEGNAVGLAAGYHLATGKIPVVYMQNSGEGNIVNPVASLLNDKVYGIPAIFIVGWRGEPGVHDEPQHIYQGEITKELLTLLDIKSMVISSGTTEEELKTAMEEFCDLLDSGKQTAFIIRKGALTYEGPVAKKQGNGELVREDVIRIITSVSGTDPVISTTGKASRELFEIRTLDNSTHATDFLTVGSMGHCSCIALSVAAFKPDSVVWIIDGDGAALMHLGALPVIASARPGNLIHVVINNGSHETVGGQPTAAGSLKLAQIALDCGYTHTSTVSTLDSLERALKEAKGLAEEKQGPVMIEVNCALGSRSDLGRPTTTAMENKENFMDYLSKL